MKRIEENAAFFFILAVAILSIISVLGVWDFFSEDVITKSFETLGLLAVVAVIVMVAGKYFDHDSSVVQVSPIFGVIRKITLTTLVISVSFLAILGVLAIWEVIKDKDVLYKSLSTVSIIAFGSFLIVMTARDRENSNLVLPTQPPQPVQ